MQPSPEEAKQDAPSIVAKKASKKSFLTISEAAEWLNLPRERVSQWVRRGVFTGVVEAGSAKLIPTKQVRSLGGTKPREQFKKSGG